MQYSSKHIYACPRGSGKAETARYKPRAGFRRAVALRAHPAAQTSPQDTTTALRPIHHVHQVFHHAFHF